MTNSYSARQPTPGASATPVSPENAGDFQVGPPRRSGHDGEATTRFWRFSGRCWEGPVAQRWEGEVGIGGRPGVPHLTPALLAPRAGGGSLISKPLPRPG